MNMDIIHTAEDVAFEAGYAHARGDAHSRLPASSSASEKQAWLAGVRCGKRIRLREREQALSDSRRAGYEPRH